MGFLKCLKKKGIILGIGMVILFLSAGLLVITNKKTKMPQVKNQTEDAKEAVQAQESITKAKLEPKPEAMSEPERSQESEAMPEPEVMPEPGNAQEPEVTSEPRNAQEPEVTFEPGNAQELKVTPESEDYQKSEATPKQEVSQEVGTTWEPELSPEPESTQEPSASQEQAFQAAHVCVIEILRKEPECVNPGNEKEYCTECDKILDEREIPALGHAMKVAVWESATCLKNGFYNNICERCGLTESVTEAPLEHVVEDVVIREGNCMEDTIVRHMCKNCGQQVCGDTRYTPQTHQWTETEVDGELLIFCQWCGVAR